MSQSVRICEEWTIAGEGNANIVMVYSGTDPNLVRLLTVRTPAQRVHHNI